MGLNLSNIRIGFACKERWDDMVGDAQVRDCAKCKKAVFNLSEMTTAEAEAVLARRGVKPCVRFYRRPDGTVVTSDSCATAARPERRRLAVVASTFAGTALAASPALADPSPDVPPASEDAPAVDTPEAPDPGTEQIQIETHLMMGLPALEPTRIEIDRGRVGEPIMGELIGIHEQRPLVEWSTWARLGYGLAAHAPTLLARASHPPIGEVDSTWEAALGADLTLGVGMHGDIRFGAWGEFRTSSGPVIGGELVIEGLPPHPYDSSIGGSGTILLRAGANEHVATWAVGFGYVGSFPRFDPWVSWARHVVGLRLVASTNYSLDNSHDWSATFGVELEPIGVIAKALGVASR